MHTETVDLMEMERSTVGWSTSVILDPPETDDYIREKAIETLRQECEKRGISLLYNTDEHNPCIYYDIGNNIMEIYSNVTYFALRDSMIYIKKREM